MYYQKCKISRNTIGNHNDAIDNLLYISNHLDQLYVEDKGRYIVAPSWFIEHTFALNSPFWVKNKNNRQDKVNTGMYAGTMCGIEVYRRLPDVEPIEDALLIYGRLKSN
jgi:hypothetical protein